MYKKDRGLEFSVYSYVMVSREMKLLVLLLELSSILASDKLSELSEKNPSKKQYFNAKLEFTLNMFYLHCRSVFSVYCCHFSEQVRLRKAYSNSIFLSNSTGSTIF